MRNILFIMFFMLMLGLFCNPSPNLNCSTEIKSIEVPAMGCLTQPFIPDIKANSHDLRFIECPIRQYNSNTETSLIVAEKKKESFTGDVYYHLLEYNSMETVIKPPLTLAKANIEIFDFGLQS